MKLTLKTFFSDLIFHPSQADTKRDKAISLIATIACGVFSLGICHLVCAIKRYCFTSKQKDQLNEQDKKILKVRDAKLKNEEMPKKILEVVKVHDILLPPLDQMPLFPEIIDDKLLEIRKEDPKPQIFDNPAIKKEDPKQQVIDNPQVPIADDIKMEQVAKDIKPIQPLQEKDLNKKDISLDVVENLIKKVEAKDKTSKIRIGKLNSNQRNNLKLNLQVFLKDFYSFFCQINNPRLFDSNKDGNVKKDDFFTLVAEGGSYFIYYNAVNKELGFYTKSSAGRLEFLIWATDLTLILSTFFQDLVAERETPFIAKEIPAQSRGQTGFYFQTQI